MATPNHRPITNPGYRFPTGGRRVGTLVCGVLMALSLRREYIEPGSYLFDNLLSKSQPVAQYAKIIQNVLFYFLFGAHALETLHFAATKLAKHGVSLASFPGLSWIVTVFVGGSFAVQEFDLVVANGVGKIAKSP